MLTVEELKNLIKDMDDSLPVYVIADHGQTYIQAGSIYKDKTDELGYYLEGMDEEGTIPVCVISD